MAVIYHLVEEDILRNATREEFARYEKVIRLCGQLKHILIIFKSSQGIQNNNTNNQEPKEDYFEQFLKKRKIGSPVSIVESEGAAHQRVSRDALGVSVTVYRESMSHNLDAPIGKSILKKVQNSAQNIYNKLSVKNGPASQVSVRETTPIEGTIYKEKNAFIDDLVKVGYSCLKDCLMHNLHAQTLFEQYAFIIDEFIAYEIDWMSDDSWRALDISIVDLLFRKQQWSLLVVALNFNGSLLDNHHIKQVPGGGFVYPQLQAALLGQTAEEAEFRDALKNQILSVSDALYSDPLDKVRFLCNASHWFFKIGSKEHIALINKRVFSLVQSGCVTLSKEKVPQAEMAFIAQVMDFFIDEEVQNWLLKRADTHFFKLVTLYHKKASASQNIITLDENDTDLATAVYSKAWPEVIERLIAIPIEKWETLKKMIEHDSADLVVKAFLLRASHIPIKNKKDNSVKTLADVLANRLIELSGNQPEGSAVEYLTEAIDHSVLSFVLSGHPLCDLVINSSAKHRVRKVIFEQGPAQFLDIICDSVIKQAGETPMTVIELLADCCGEDPLPCKYSTAQHIYEAYSGKNLVDMIVENYKKTEDHASVIKKFERFLNPKSPLIQLMGSHVEFLRQEYNRRKKAIFLKKLSDYNPQDINAIGVNPKYEGFFSDHLKQLNIIIENKCSTYQKSSDSFLNIRMGEKTEPQMRAELEALYALRSAIVQTRNGIAQDGIDGTFLKTLRSAISNVAENHPEGFEKSGKGKLGIKPSKTVAFYNQLASAAEKLAARLGHAELDYRL